MQCCLSLSTDQPTSSSLCLHAPSPPSTPPPSLGLSPSPPPSPPSLQCSSPPPPPSPNLFTPTVDQVRTQLKKIKARKATGPDGISSRLLRDCADQLCQVVSYIFNLSLSLERVPVLWKTSCVVPVPKTSQNFAPQGAQPLQTRGLNISPDEGTGEESSSGTSAPCAFNTIHPSLLRVKLERAGASDQLAAWVTNYLTDRPQFVRLQDCVSDVVVCSTGAPQGTVLSPFLFTLYTSGLHVLHRTVATSRSSPMTLPLWDVCQRGTTVSTGRSSWTLSTGVKLNHLQVNASKTKEMVIDFSRKPSADIAPLNIQGLDIERVRTYKPLLRTFYETVVASVVSYAVVCWGGGCSERDKKRLNRLIKRASSVCGCPLDSIEVMGERSAYAEVCQELRGESSTFQLPEEEESLLSLLYQVSCVHGPGQVRCDVDAQELDIVDTLNCFPVDEERKRALSSWTSCSPL
ncbi:hypothetical protein L3Q82_005869 [Scortum barcoo]|uniref:Uncharacterized protein n=1 Tax=Scortum barcoo TaxID=214431 RepID=A0ACB8V9W3_9TELE|nr:hypothetical protein L3Q82_005869 [Scortum barcoo]